MVSYVDTATSNTANVFVSGVDAVKYYGVGIKIESNTMSVSTGDCCIQIANISYTRKGLVEKTVKYPTMLIAIIWIAAVIAAAILYFGTGGNAWQSLVGCGAFAIVVTFILLGVRTKTTNHYGLLVGLSCKSVFSFISVNENVITDAYNFLKEAIDTEHFTDSRTFNFGAAFNQDHATPLGPDNIDTPPTITAPPPTPHPTKDYNSEQLISDLLRSIEEIRYSNELSDHHRHQLYNIFMDAKEGIEQNSQADIERSRIRFREIARTRDSWPNLFKSIWERHDLVEFFRGS